MLTFAVVALALIVAAMVAGAVPARRAATIDAIIALKGCRVSVHVIEETSHDFPLHKSAEGTVKAMPGWLKSV
jgi:hypothetical protein